MKGGGFILSIVKKIEDAWGIIAFASFQNNLWEICVSDYDIYYNDKRFKILTKAWHQAAQARGVRILFCYCKPNEKMLANLMKDDNLILNVTPEK